jgi:hypothetical protein
MPVWLQTIHGLHPLGVLRTTRFVPDESVTGMTVKTLLQSFLKINIPSPFQGEEINKSPSP